MFYSVHQRDFGLKVWFEARCDSEARVRALFLMTALRGENCWGKKLYLAPVPTDKVQSPFFAGGFFQELDPLRLGFVPICRPMRTTRKGGQIALIQMQEQQEVNR